MRTLRICDNAVEASIVKTRLDAAGILAVVNGGEVATTLSHIGTALRVRVEVAPEDFERASAILDNDDLERSVRAAWQCSRCDEHNDPSFDLCWACGKQHEPGDRQVDQKDDDRPPTQSTGPLTVDPTEFAPKPANNPYAPPSSPKHASAKPVGYPGEPSADRVAEESELTVTRIFRGAIFGTVVLPPLLTCYVLCMLCFYVPGTAYRVPRLRRKLIASWVLCGLSLVFAAIFWTQFR